MSWLLFALLAPMAYGGSNVLDNYLASKLFKNVWTLTVYSTLFNTFFALFIFLVATPGLPPVSLIPFLILVGFIETVYLYPYYKALQHDDTSIVASLFTLGRVLVPILAFFLVGETLQWHHYLGFLVITLGSAALTVNGDSGKFRLNASFWYMLICSLLLSVEVVIYKYLFEQLNWSTGFFWITISVLPTVACLLLVPSIRKNVVKERRVFKKHFWIFGLEEFFNFIGAASATYAISLAPVTLVKGIGALQPMFVLLYAVILARFFPKVFSEHTNLKNLFKKGLLFAIMVIGVVLVTQ
jgi:drug/metabolite transporter (DMT)-like permease